MITATEKIKKLKINILVGKRMNSWDNASIKRYIKLSLLVFLVFLLRFYLYVFVSRSQKMVGGDSGEGNGGTGSQRFFRRPFRFFRVLCNYVTFCVAFQLWISLKQKGLVEER